MIVFSVLWHLVHTKQLLKCSLSKMTPAFSVFGKNTNKMFFSFSNTAGYMNPPRTLNTFQQSKDLQI